MFRRRRSGADRPDEVADIQADDSHDAEAEPAGLVEATPDAPVGKPPRPNGPWDVAEVDLDGPGEREGRIDLGGLLIRGAQGMQLQLQVDEQTGVATSALVVLGDAAVQVLAVAAPRNVTMWPETRAQVAADASRRGGTVTEAEGPLGTELRLAMPVKLPDGTSGLQPSRMVGIDGPRWLLRVTFLGRAAAEEEAFARLAAVVRDVVVVRGGQAMPPGDVIGLRLPREASTEEPASERRPGLEDLEPGPTITEIR